MNEFKGTPGPWEYAASFVRVKGSSDSIALLHPNVPSEDGYLMAAAPALLAALIGLRDWVDTLGQASGPLMEAADIAIAKALGQEVKS